MRIFFEHKQTTEDLQTGSQDHDFIVKLQRVLLQLVLAKNVMSGARLALVRSAHQTQKLFALLLVCLLLTRVLGLQRAQ